MAISAFKSTSKKGKTSVPSAPISSTKNCVPEDPAKKIPSRRARSVSAAPRRLSNASSSSDASEFLNTRDNPLFSCSSSTSPESKEPVGISNGSRSDAGNRRSRSVSRNSGSNGQSSSSRSHAGRSLTRVNTDRRGRSVSRSHHANYENLVDRCSVSSSSRSKKNDNDKLNCQKFVVEGQGFGEQRRNLQTWTSRHTLPRPWETSGSCGKAQHWEDANSTSSFSELDEVTFSLSDYPPSDAAVSGIYETVRSRRAFSENRNSLENVKRARNPAVITTDDSVDKHPEFVNLSSIELVSEMRREYATKLKQSQERARKLRADLAVEEQREEELNRILKEILPDPKSSDTQKTRPGRMRSIERVKMSRRLAEEALNYFDECVSISTFDSSDFSSLEEPQLSLVPGAPPTGSSRYVQIEGSNLSSCHLPATHINNHEELDKQAHWLRSSVGSDLFASSICGDGNPAKLMEENGNHDDQVDFGSSGALAFSFASAQLETDGVHDIRDYTMKFEKGSTKGGHKHVKERLSYNSEDYDVHKSDENFLFDQLFLRRRIDFGGLLLCDIRSFF